MDGAVAFFPEVLFQRTMDIKDTKDFIALCRANWKLGVLLPAVLLVFVFAKGYCERKGQSLAENPARNRSTPVANDRDSLGISLGAIEANVKAIQGQAREFAYLSSEQRDRVLELIRKLARNMVRRDNAFVNDRSVDFVNHVISGRSAGILWDEVNMLSDLFVALDEPSLRILSAYKALGEDSVTIWKEPRPRAYTGDVSLDTYRNVRTFYDLNSGWLALDEAIRNFRTQAIVTIGWHSGEEGRGDIRLTPKGKALVDYTSASIALCTPQNIR